MENLNKFWRCPKDSCEQKKFKINRNQDNIIDGDTYRKIIYHFLQHLKKSNIYFGGADIYNIFLDNSPDNILSKEDRDVYPDYGSGYEAIKWKTQIRSTLATLAREGYIETDDINEIPDKYNLDIDDKRKLRTRKRTDKFFQEFKDNIYNDWELYTLEGILSIEVEDDSIEFIIPEPSLKSPFLDFKDDKIFDHGQIQGKEFYDYFKKKNKETNDNFSFNLKYICIKKSEVFSDDIKATIKGGIAYAVLLFTFIKKLIENGYCELADFKPGNILKFSKIKNKNAFLLEINKIQKEIIISKREFIESLKDLLEYSQTILKFFNLTEEKKNFLIDEIYKNNSLEYFETINKEFNKEGPIRFLRHIILSQFIEDKRRNFENTKVNIDFIKNNIETLWTKGIDGKKFDKSSFDSRWTNNYYVRVLLTFYDFKYKHNNRKKILNIIKLLLRELNLEDVNYLNDLEIDEDGKIGLKIKELKTKIVELKNVKFSIIDFEARGNNAYSWDPWIAIYPAYFEDHQKAYQLFFQINKFEENEIQIGLYPGYKLVTNKCKDNKNLKKIILNFNNENIVEEIVDFYKKVISDYKKLNELEKEYHDYDKIKCWFGSPQPPKNEVYEGNMFAEMMEKGYYALGWDKFQEDMSGLTTKQIESKFNKIESLSGDVKNFHIDLKEKMSRGDIIIAKKGDRSQNPDNRIFGIGIINSEYKFDKNLDKYGTNDSHYREVEWYINFYNDYKNKIIPNPYIDLKDILKDTIHFRRKTLIPKDFDFYIEIKKALLTKLTELKRTNSAIQKVFDNYLNQFKELEDKSRCIKAYLTQKGEEEEIRPNYWIFQSRPDFFNLEDAIKELDKDTFMANKEEIKKGDIVLFWVSGKNAGIVGYGEVLTNPEMQEPNPKSKKYILNPIFNEKKKRVWVSYNPIFPIIFKSDLVKNYQKIASQLTIIRAPQGTNFKIREIDWNFFKNNFIFNEISKESITHLISGRNLVFYGPPGTGKTRTAITITERFCGKENYKFETAHAEWTAYNVIGGPTIAGTGSLTFKPGFLTLAAKKCGVSLNRDKNDKPSPYWLIIDEINRANLDLAFGKIFTLLDIEYRNQNILDESELKGLIDTDEYKNVRIPKNFRILATMNTYDKAILFSLGYAFRRRFAFIEIDSQFNKKQIQNYRLNERNWKNNVENINNNKIIKEFQAEIDSWIRKKEYFLKLPTGLKFIITPDMLNNDIKSGRLNPYNPYKFVYMLAEYLTTNKIVDIGYAQPMDLIKYTLIKVSLFSGNLRNLEMVKAIDSGVMAYFFPHIEYYLPKARRKMTMGEVNDAKEVEKKLLELKKLFRRLGLKKSGRMAKEMISRLKIGETRIF